MDDEYIFKVTINCNDDYNYSVVLKMDGFDNLEDAEYAATMLLSVLESEERLDLH